jgi:hypothetical protein
MVLYSHNTRLTFFLFFFGRHPSNFYCNTSIGPSVKADTCIVRSMMSGTSLHAARAAYHCAAVLVNTEMVDQITSLNYKPFVKPLIALSVDHQKGVPQHKTSLIKHALSQKFPSEDFFESFHQLENVPKVHWEPHTSVDVRVLNELPVLHTYYTHHHNDLDWVIATCDARPANFPHQIQTNQDFWVGIIPKIDRAMGLSIKCVPQDEKSGMDMLRHTLEGA